MGRTRPGRTRLVALVRDPEVWVLVVGALLFAVGVWRELPFVYHADEHRTFNTTVGMLDRHSLDPQFFRYPTLMFELHLLVLLPFELFGSVEPMTRIALASAHTDAPALVALLRSVTVLAALLAVGAAMRVTRALGAGRIGAVTTGALLVLSPMMIEHSHYITTDMYAAALSTAAVVAALAVQRSGSWRAYLVAGALVGFAGGAKYNAVLVAVAVVVAHLLPTTTSASGARATLRAAVVRARLERLFGAGGAAIVAFVVSTPYAVLSPGRWWDDVSFEMRHYSLGHRGSGESSPFKYVGLLVGTYTMAALLALVPLVVRRTRRSAAVVASFALGYLAFVSRYPLRFERTILPMLPCFAALVGVGVALLVERVAPTAAGEGGAAGGARRRPLVLVGVAVLGLTAITPGIVESVDVEHRTLVDVRGAAREWIAANVAADSRVVVTGYAPWVDPERYHVEVMTDPGTPADYRGRADLIVLAEGEFGRYCRFPDEYPGKVRRFNQLVKSFRTAAAFEVLDYRIVVLDPTQPAATRQVEICD